MSKLFIQPPQYTNYALRKTIDALKEKGYKCILIGHGFPPMYVETDRANFDEIKAIALAVHDETQFFPYRLDLIEPIDLISGLGELGFRDLVKVCVVVGLEPAAIPGYQERDVTKMAVNLTAKARNGDLKEKLVEAIYSIYPDLLP